MDLAEIKEWRGTGPASDFMFPRTMRRIDWLIAEVERLANERDELESDIVRYKMHLECAERAAKANGKLAEELQPSLTRSKAEGRREGMEEAAKIAEDRLLYDRRGGHTGNAAGTSSNIAAAIRQQAVQPTEEKADVCGWKAWDDESGCYDTGCGNVQYFSEGGVTDNRYKVCPYCGKNILVKA